MGALEASMTDVSMSGALLGGECDSRNRKRIPWINLIMH